MTDLSFSREQPNLSNGVITITHMKSRIVAIQKLLPPTTVKVCKSLFRVVNCLSLLQRFTENTQVNI